MSVCHIAYNARRLCVNPLNNPSTGYMSNPSSFLVHSSLTFAPDLHSKQTGYMSSRVEHAFVEPQEKPFRLLLFVCFLCNLQSLQIAEIAKGSLPYVRQLISSQKSAKATESIHKMLVLRMGFPALPLSHSLSRSISLPPIEEYLQVSKLWKCERVRLNARNLIVRQGQSMQIKQIAGKHAQM